MDIEEIKKKLPEEYFFKRISNLREELKSIKSGRKGYASLINELKDQYFRIYKKRYEDGYTGYNDKNGEKIFIDNILSLDGETNIDTTRCGYVRLFNGEFVSFYGQDSLGRDCYDILNTVNSDREIIGNTTDGVAG